jgi:cytochrome c biogenesis factor
VGLAVYSGFSDMTDEDQSSGPGFFDTSDVRLFSIKVALIGLLIVAATSTIGVALPATYNLGVAIFDPTHLADKMIGMGTEFFRIGFYASCVFLIGSAFYCMRTTFLTYRLRSMIVIGVFLIGAIISAVSVFGGLGPLPTNYWPANFLIIPAVAGIGFLVIAFIRLLVGRDQIGSTRQIGRLMLHLGLIILLLGVFMSENVVYETNAGYAPNSEGVYPMQEVGPNVYIQVQEVILYWNGATDFNMIVTVNVIENTAQGFRITGIGYTTVTANPTWNMVSHSVYLDSTAFRDVFIAVTGFSQIGTDEYQVTIHTEILPLISFVWIGALFMVLAMLPMLGIEMQSLLKSIHGKEAHLYEDDEDVPEASENGIPETQGN